MPKVDGAQYWLSSLIWEDETFNQLDWIAQKVWLYLLCGRCRTRLPGLISTGPAVISSRIGLVKNRGFSPDEIAAALNDLSQAGMIIADWPHHLVRLPKATRYTLTPQPQYVRGWWAIWKTLPRSPLRYEHLPSLFEDCIKDSTSKVLEVWQETFQPALEQYLRQSQQPPPLVDQAPPRVVLATDKQIAEVSASAGVNGTKPKTAVTYSERVAQRKAEREAQAASAKPKHD